MQYIRVSRGIVHTDIWIYNRLMGDNRKSFKKRYSGNKDDVYKTRSSIRRAKKQFFDIVNETALSRKDLPFFLTLTYHDYSPAAPISTTEKHRAKFFAKLKKLVGNDLTYVCVPEYQKRGYIHYHALVWGLPAVFHRERYTRHLQRLWSRGYVDVSRTTYVSEGLAGYLAKYFTKSFVDSRFSNRRAYTSSYNVSRKTIFGTNQGDFFYPHIIKDSILINSTQYDTQYLGRVTHNKFLNKYENRNNG